MPAPAAAPAATLPPRRIPSLAQGLRIEQIVAPAAVEQRQVGGAGVVPGEGVEPQQRFHAGLLALAHLLVQVAGGFLHGAFAAGHQAPAGGDVDQQFGDQPLPGAQARGGLGLMVGDQPVELRPGALQQQRQALVEAPLAVQRRRHAVETHQGVQAQASEGGAPLLLAMLRAGDEVQHRQQRPAAAGEHRQFVAILGQHRFAGVDHVEPGVGGEQLADHLGFLFETPARFVAVQQPRHAFRAIETLAGALQGVQVVEQGDGVFQAGRVVEFQQRFAVHRQPGALDVAGGAGAMGDFAESTVASQGAQQRGLAGIGVADHGQDQRLSHGRSPARPAARSRRAAVAGVPGRRQSPRRSLSSASPGGAWSSQMRVLAAQRASSPSSARVPRSGERRGSQAMARRAGG